MLRGLHQVYFHLKPWSLCDISELDIPPTELTTKFVIVPVISEPVTDPVKLTASCTEKSVIIDEPELTYTRSISPGVELIETVLLVEVSTSSVVTAVSWPKLSCEESAVHKRVSTSRESKVSWSLKIDMIRYLF
eukprot:Lithocolla_globosa_v1_NODE_93_length_6512_cov_4.841877.p6 type:complete len:134 gc:universal NODE_93_length_6512_cov_4.841877:6343-5942(-)